MKDFKTKIKIKADPDDVWMAFTNANSIELWSGSPATFSPEPGNEFSLMEGDIQGKVLEAEPIKKLVEQWYFEGVTSESVATINFFPQKNSVLVEVSHVNIPDEAYDNISYGWENYFLRQIKTFCEIGY
ncbi:MAG: SRPBCC domain-containing protein [Candidatus Delongbacteria bacterium]|jgi:activator of HSP90 ATPase|nr:SRPBCC domain-containing protein [Candidatus Delongbacteria bacterium]